MDGGVGGEGEGEQDIVMRDGNGEFQIGDLPLLSFEEVEGEERGEDESEFYFLRVEGRGGGGDVLMRSRGETEVSGFGEASSEG